MSFSLYYLIIGHRSLVPNKISIARVNRAAGKYSDVDNASERAGFLRWLITDSCIKCAARFTLSNCEKIVISLRVIYRERRLEEEECDKIALYSSDRALFLSLCVGIRPTK